MIAGTGGDIIWQVVTGYPGCRMSDGRFDAAAFVSQGTDPPIRMIGVKPSQGAIAR